MNLSKSRIPLLFLFGLCAAFTFAYNPPVGGDAVNTYLSPDLLGGTSSASGGPFGTALPGALAANPALAAGEQRIILDASYAAIVGNGDDTGLGNIFNLGVLIPTRWAVIGGSFNLLSSPFYSLPLGTSATFRGSLSKDLSEKLYVGAGLSGTTGTGWGAALDLGVLYLYGDIGFMQDVRFGFSLTGIGRAFTPDETGINGGTATGYTSPFTPRFGTAATFLKTKDVKFGASADISLPTFQNLVFDTGLEAVFRDFVILRTGWGFNIAETAKEVQTYVPSVSIGFNLKLNSPKEDSFLARNGWAQSEMTPTFAVKPLFNDLYAVGAGVNIKLGVIDRTPPDIAVTYPAPVYFSPNNDGVQDELLLPVEIRDQRDIVSWSFIIENDKGEIARVIANKEVRPEMQSIKATWQALTRVKQGVTLPENLRWDGILDSGETAPDGTYSFHIVAEDDNKNAISTERFTVYVDNTAPVITAVAPAGANAMIFSPDGDGNKDTFRIVQSGSPEDLWTATVLDSASSVVRTNEQKATAPADFSWDGKTNTNVITADGVYSYRVSAKDRAGNTAEARIDNIIVDTEKPSINITIDINAFSPNGDGVRDAVVFSPSIPVVNGLIEWKIAVENRTGETVRTWTGSAAIAKTTAFDGKNNDGKVIPEGDYQTVISARYINGYAPVARSPFFTLDVTAPDAQIRASGSIFSPVGDGKLDTVTFTQQASAETEWNAQVFALDGAGKPSASAIKTWNYGAVPETATVWDGRDDAGKLAPDGKYAYRLTSTDRAGNTGYSNSAVVELNTEKADLILQANLSAFSPNGDSSKDAIVFTPILKAATAVAEYKLTVTDKSGKPVKTFAGTGKVPATFTWNGIVDPASGTVTGARSPDGMYGASLEVTLVNQQVSRSAAPDFEIDTVFPAVEISVPYTQISPNGDGARDILAFTQNSSKEDLWAASLASDKKAVVRSYKWNGSAASFDWDATDNSGNRVADGTYSYTVTSEDRAGNKTSQQLTGISVDARTPKAYITSEYAAFSPNGDGIKDTQKFTIVTNITEGLESWSVAVKPEAVQSKEAPVKLWDSTTTKVLPAFFTWDGKTSDGKPAQGKYVAELTLSYVKGDKVAVSTPAFLVNAQPPALNVSLSPKYFSPDNDGNEDELFISLGAKSASGFTDWSFEIREPEGTNGNVFWKTGGTGSITERIIWDGRSAKGELVQAATDYPFTFTVKDEVGMTTTVRGYIPVDVMVIRDGDKLKIAVPSIIFRENAADFNGLDSAVVDKNTQVLRRIAEILNKFRDYKVQVEGHANNVTGTQKEEDAELIPLSQKRAEAVKNFLVRNGVDAARLSTIGMGGTRPLVQRTDRENWWKNRRVEFILIK